MPQYRVTDPKTGRTVTLTGDSPPTEAELSDIFSAVGQGQSEAGKAQPPAQAPSVRPSIGTVAKDVAVGIGKGAANTAIGAGQVMGYVFPPAKWAGQAVSDVVEMASTGRPPAKTPFRPFEAAREAAAPTNTAQRVGFGAEQIAEFFAPGAAGEKAAAWITTKLAPHLGQAPAAVRTFLSMLPRMATEGATAASVAGMQTGSPTTAGVAGALGAAGPVASKAVEATAGRVAKPATKLVQQALGAGKERFKAMAEKVAPEILRRNVGGVTGMSRETLLAKASTEAKAAGKAIDATLTTSGGQAVKTAPLVSALEDAKSAFKIEHPVTAAQLASDPKLAKAAREISPGQFVTDVVLDDRTIRHLSKLQKTLSDLGPEATVNEVVAVRRAWDAVVDQAGGFSQRAKGAIGVPLKDSSEAWAKREATTAIRKVLAADVPDLAKVNKEYAFWASVRDVLRQTEKRTAPQEGSLGRNVMTAAGMVAGASSGDSMIDRTEKAILAGALARRIDVVVRSPRWRMASAQMRNNLADAIAEGNVAKVTFFANRVMAGGAAQAAR